MGGSRLKRFSILVGDKFSHTQYDVKCDSLCEYCRLKFVCLTNRSEKFMGGESSYIRLPEGSEDILVGHFSDVEVVKVYDVNK